MWYRLVSGLVALILLAGAAIDGHAQTSVSTKSGDRSTSVLDDSFVRENGMTGLDRLYNMKFEEARARFEKINQRYPNHPIGPFLKGLNLWWTIMLDLTDTSHDEAFFEQMDEVNPRSDHLMEQNQHHFDAALFKGAAHGFKARLHSNRSNWWKTIRNGKTAISYVRDVADRAPDGGDYVFGKGMYDYYAATLPEEYPLSQAIMWVLPEGNKERGLELLRETAENGRYVQTEAVYFLAKIYYLYEDDYRYSRKYVSWLREHHPDNPFFHNFEGRVYARWGRWGQARRVFQEILDRRDEGRSGYTVHMEELARYYLARERLYRDHYEEALTQLAELEQLTRREIEDTRYRMLGYLYQGMVYDALGKRDMAVNRYRKVLQLEDHAGAHERARKYLDSPYEG